MTDHAAMSPSSLLGTTAPTICTSVASFVIYPTHLHSANSAADRTGGICGGWGAYNTFGGRRAENSDQEQHLVHPRYLDTR